MEAASRVDASRPLRLTTDADAGRRCQRACVWDPPEGLGSHIRREGVPGERIPKGKLAARLGPRLESPIGSSSVIHIRAVAGLSALALAASGCGDGRAKTVTQT